MKKKDVVRINDILELVASYHPDFDHELIQKAYIFSAKVHHGQTRLSGEPYLSHPLSVAKILAEYNLDEFTIATGILHDTVEDTHTTLEEIKDVFGSEVAFLVDGVTKISKLTIRSRLDRQAENFRKMILAMSKDIRVILIKLADRIHNMRTLQYMPPDKQKKIAEQTADIYAPLANRLGIFSIKRELEDISLSYTHEHIYSEINKNLVVASGQREKYVDEVIEIIKDKMQHFGLNLTVTGRHKHICSIYSKMLKQNLDFNQIYDLTAFRLIVDSRSECYEVLGIIHSIWKPVTGRFKDYISLPKANMYQSLHTTVIGPYGQRIEIQIRTNDMDKVAKHGIAAHWKYKEGRKIDQKTDERFQWLQQVMEAHSEAKDPHELLESFRVDVLSDEVYVFTPAGEVIGLPVGATPVDFAFRIHSDIGHKCTGVKINGIIATLKHFLKSGDIVEIITSSNQHPSRDWLKFVKTSKARIKIRQWINNQEREKSIGLGRGISEKEFRRLGLNFSRLSKGEDFLKKTSNGNIKSMDDFFAAVGLGRIKIRQIANRFLEEKPGFKKDITDAEHIVSSYSNNLSDKGIIIDGIDDIMVKYGKCCNPIPGDRIKGFITRGRGITLHNIDCSFLKSADIERVIDAQWDSKCKHVAAVPVEVLCEDKQGILVEIISSISSMKTNIINAKIKSLPDKKAVNVFDVEISSIEHLEQVFKALRKVKGVLKVDRLRSQVRTL